MSPALRNFYLAVLISAILLDAAVLYLPSDPTLRLLFGLLLLPVILRAGSRLEVMEQLASHPRWAARGRRFRELRSQVVLLLEHVRRLNWIAVDAEHGFRAREEALQEMDAIEEHLRALVTEVRQAAGRPTEDPGAKPVERPETVE